MTLLALQTLTCMLHAFESSNHAICPLFPSPDGHSKASQLEVFTGKLSDFQFQRAEAHQVPKYRPSFCGGALMLW